MSNQHTDLSWRDTPLGQVPISTRYDDPYYSLDNGLAETNHVFLHGNDLPDRFHAPLRIAELGFGTGLNFLATVVAWQNHPNAQPFHFTSFEGFPLSTPQATTALAAFPDLDTAPLLAIWEAAMKGPTHFAANITLEVITGDVRKTLPAWSSKADAWYLDGFSPAKNPDMWEDTLMHAVGTHTETGGTFATYTAAGHVRRALTDAGFDISRVPGFGRKRHMTQGVKQG